MDVYYTYSGNCFTIFIRTSNHAVYLKIIQCYMSIISQSQKKKEKENSTNQSLLPNVIN